MIRPVRNRPTVLFSGGGTVGHLAPGFALAAALEERGVRAVFATPGEAREADWFAQRPEPLTVPAPRIPRSPREGVTFAPHMVRGLFDALALIRRERVDAVVALGGWPCVPAVLAARIARRPIAFVVADAVPGLVVSRLGKLADRIYVACPAARAALGGAGSVCLSGPLIRPEVLEARSDARAFGLDPDKLTVLVLGGSLGARGLFERWRLGLQSAVVEDPELTDRLQVLHSVGGQGDGARAMYERLGLDHHVVPFLHDMGTAYATADLVLARSGASTCAELLATRTPAVLVPYPHHADRQQFENAAPLVASGGAALIEEGDLDHEAIARHVIARTLDADRLAAMRTALAQDETDGVDQTADDLVRLIGREAGRGL